MLRALLYGHDPEGLSSMTAAHFLYSDFNCPFCYAMHERLHEMNLLARCEWRGVQHASHLPRPMKPWQGSLGAELRHEVTVVQRLAPGLPIALPPGKPNTRPAIEQSVVLLRRDRSHMMTFVRETYRAFWCEGRDISDPVVLRQLVEQVGGSSESMGTINDEDRRVAQEWEGRRSARRLLLTCLAVSQSRRPPPTSRRARRLLW